MRFTHVTHLRIGTILALYLAIGLLFAPQPALAQEQTQEEMILETITVTAAKRETDAQAVPISMTVLSGVDVEDAGLVTLEDLFYLMPNIHLSIAGPAADIASSVAVRGVANSMSGSPSVGFFVDDVYYNEIDLNLVDVERIELLRGPQGTLYGRNTLAGALNIITRKPTADWTGRITAGIGSHNSREIRATLSGPIREEDLFFRLAGRFSRSDGYFTNAADNDDAVNEPEDMDVNLRFRYTPTPDLTLDLGVDALEYTSRYTEYVPLANIETDPHTANVDYKGASEKKALGTHLKADLDRGAYKLLSITTLRRDDNKLDHDMDFTPVDGQRQLYQRDYVTASQELRMVSDNSTSPFQWLTGLYGFKETQDHNLTYTLGQDFAAMFGIPAGAMPVLGESDILGAAIFGEGSYTFSNDIKLTAGLRYDRETQDFSYDGTGSGRPKGETDAVFDAILPKFVASYTGFSNILPYANVTRGYKAGGFNLQNNPGQKFDPEYTWNYEAGIKTQWPEHRLTLNTSVYHIDWTDMQVNSGSIDFVMDNAASASSYGVEIELGYQPVAGLKITGGFAYNRTEFDDYRIEGTSGGGGLPPRPAQDFSGKRVPNMPDYTARLGFTWRNLSGVFTGMDYIYTGKAYKSFDNFLSQSGYHLVNSRIGYEKNGFEIYLWTKNLFDEEYGTAFVDFRSMGQGLWARPGNPRTFGLSLGYRF